MTTGASPDGGRGSSGGSDRSDLRLETRSGPVSLHDNDKQQQQPAVEAATDSLSEGQDGSSTRLHSSSRAMARWEVGIGRIRCIHTAGGAGGGAKNMTTSVLYKICQISPTDTQTCPDQSQQKQGGWGLIGSTLVWHWVWLGIGIRLTLGLVGYWH